MILTEVSNASGNEDLVKSHKTHLGVTIKRALIEAMDVTEVTLHIHFSTNEKK